ncbi:hypothetical protein MSG28_007586 [Choristoneura fumiferana]|uniref:Uncharacterized protein n=2 Tax=Choristoneura fumiferana TaxID=7141 RepID=A0ACC0JY45_CHOFU|nr:hypothetical protein MSG28_007586 [Choristoneura fumiferana]KAI8428998.1 hypothetical protein MSG28_007586 [Choristoneura fumiferana]
MLPLEIRLEITARETLNALRATLLHTHWHTFTLLAEEDIYSTLSLRNDLSSILTAQPLNPSWLLLPSKFSRHTLFRRLAEISRLTRGVVVLICDIHYAKLVMDEAERLNMLDGHFFWLWIDASREIDVFRNIGNRTLYSNTDDLDFDSSREKDGALRYEHLERSKRDYVDNNLIKDIIDHVTAKHFDEISKEHSNDEDRADLRKDEEIVNIRHRIALESDSSDFLMNPTVPTPTSYKVRDLIEKRGDKQFQKENNVDENSESWKNNYTKIFDSLPVGLLALHPQPMKIDRTFIRAAVRMAVGALRRVLRACDAWSAQAQFFSDAAASCWEEPSDAAADFSADFVREARISSAAALAGGTERPEPALTASFTFMNLVSGAEGANMWRQVGHVHGRIVKLHTIVWPGGRLVAHGQSSGARTIFRIVTALAPPFVMEGELAEDGQCLRGLPCHRPHTSDRDNLTIVFNELEKDDDVDEADNFFFPTPKPTIPSKMATHCCYGLAMDLLENIAQELEFDFHLYLVEDGLYGARKLVRSFHKVHDITNFLNDDITFTTPDHLNYRGQFRSGYKPSSKEEDGAPYYNDDVPYFNDVNPDDDNQKWNGIVGDLVSGSAHMSFAALSVSSARAEVIDYTQPYFYSGISLLAAPNRKPDIPLLAFLLPFSPELWIAIFTSLNVTAIAVAIYEWLSPFGLNPWGRQRNGTLDLLIADTPVLDYYRATDHGCKLQRVGDHALMEDTYAIGMAKGFPLKDSISAVIAKYSSNGYMDILTEKWYEGLPCFKLSPDYGIQPKPLGVAAVAGVFILLGVGMVVGCLILILEHLFYKYTLPVLRHQPKGTIWRSRNIMFFSQKLYRFINCVELVSPHHAARELVNTIRQGHFTSLFQKSVKRKEHEQRRRRRSKAQFFEMIQEIRRVQQGRDQSLDSIKEHVAVETSEVSEELTESKFLSPSPEVPSRSPRPGRSPRQLRSPRGRRKRCSLAGLNVRRFSTDSVLGSDSGSIYERTSLNIGRRLSRDVSCLTNSPPDINTRLRTPSPMVRRAEGSSTRSYQDVSEKSERYLNIDAPRSRASVEILVSEENDVPPAPPYPRVSPIGGRSELSRLSEEELIRLWRSSEREVRESLLAALQERRANLDPKQDPG